ncbi:MAG: hypothetical protein KC419_12015 [Anaerolineales bacterium]|nr:hypothetical protein [Anaerolineales bacterium]
MTKRANQEDSDDELFEKRIKAALFRINCPDADLLLDYKWGLLSAKKTAVIHQHLATCPYCGGELANLVAPPPISTSPSAPEKQFPQRFRTLFAQFVGHHAMTRSSQNESGRGRIISSLWYEIEALGWDLEMHWGLEPDNLFLIQGQLLGPNPEIFDSIKIDLIEEIDVETGLVKPTAKTTPDSAGLFVLEAIPAGVYALRLRTPADVIPIPDITLNMPDE